MRVKVDRGPESGDVVPQILVYKVGQLGDAVVALPALAAIRDMYPQHRVTLLTDRHRGELGYVSSWDVIRGTGFCDEVVFYDVNIGSAWQRLWSLVAATLYLRRRRFVLAYNLVLRKSKWIQRRDYFYFRVLLACGRYSATDVLDYTRDDRATIQLEPEWRRQFMAVTGHNSAPRLRFAIANMHHQLALDAVLGSLGHSVRERVFEGKRLVAVCPGAKVDAKKWPIERFGELGRQVLALHPDVSLVVLGGKGDVADAERLVEEWGSRSISFAGKLSISLSAALVSRCCVYVGLDSGMMHVAAVSGVPCVALFSARDFKGLWSPIGEQHTLLRTDVPCAVCFLDTCIKMKNECMRRIAVEDVLAAVGRALNRNPKSVFVPDRNAIEDET